MLGIYLDNHTTTKPSEKAISAMKPYFYDNWGSYVQPHSMGQQLLPAMEKAYKQIYQLLGATDRDTVLFTSSGPEAVNHVIKGVYYDIVRQEGKNHFITSSVDEAPIIMSLSHLEELGCKTNLIEVNDKGFVDAKAISEAISPRTALVSLAWANGLTGVINPVNEIADVLKQRGILFHLDASYVLGKSFFDVKEIGADFITFNGDHLHAPKGTGGLYIREGIDLSPFIIGGPEQGGKRAGVINTPGLVALGIACEEMHEHLDYMCTEVVRLRAKFEETILKEQPDAQIHFQDIMSLPNTTVISFPGMIAENLLYALNRKKVYANFGGGVFQKLSLVLRASGVERLKADSAISFAFSRYTKEKEIDQACHIIIEQVKRLKKMSEHILG